MVSGNRVLIAVFAAAAAVGGYVGLNALRDISTLDAKYPQARTCLQGKVCDNETTAQADTYAAEKRALLPRALMGLAAGMFGSLLLAKPVTREIEERRWRKAVADRVRAAPPDSLN